MLPPSVLQRWLGGETVRVVAPSLPPAALVVPDRRVLLVASDDRAALLLAAAAAAPLLLPTTGPRERNRALSGTAPQLVTSLSALRLPSFADLLREELADWPRAIFGDDDAEALVGPSLRVTPSGDGEVIDLPSGIVRAASNLAVELVGLGGGVLVDAAPGRQSLGGLPVREHRLDRPRVRDWVGAERAVRSPEPGIDVLGAGAMVGVPGRGVAVATDALFVPEGAVVITSAPPQPRAVTGADIDALRARARAGDGWLVLPAQDAALAEELARVGALADVRPAWGEAVVADGHRFRSPFLDAHDAWRELARVYGEALKGWSLPERTRLALSDQGARDLIVLADALGVRPSHLGDVLVDLAGAELVAARVSAPLVEASAGPQWEADANELAAAVMESRPGAAEWRSVEGCRTAAWRVAVGLPAGEPCGGCETCDPSGASLAGRLGAQRPIVPAPVTAEPKGAASLDALFSGLGGGATVERAPGVPGGKRLADELLGDGAVRIAELGAARAFVLVLYRFDGPGPLPSDEAVAALLDALAVAQAPWGQLPSGVSRKRGGWNVEVGAQRWSFAHRRDASGVEDAVLARLAAEDDRLARLAASIAAADATKRAFDVLESLVREGLGSSSEPVDARAQVEIVEQHRRDLEAAIGQPAPLAPGLVRVQLADEDELEALTRGFLARGGGGSLAGAQAGRELLRRGAVPALSAGELLRWLERDRPALTRERIDALLGRLESGRRGDVASLHGQVLEFHHEAVVAAGLRIGALPRELVEPVLAEGTAEDVVRALVASVPDPGRLKRSWGAHRAVLLARFPVDQLRPLVVGESAVERSLAALLDGEEEAARERAAARQEVRDLADAGRLGEAAERLAALPDEVLDAAERAALDAVKERAVARQAELVAPLAAVLAGKTGEDAEDEAFAAVEDATAEGFGRAVVALLSRQHRRAPGDPVRALWLARALCMAGDWAEGERVYRVAAGLRSDPTTRVATEFEGIFMAFEEGQAARALSWLGRALDVPWHQVLLPQVQALLDEGVVPDGRKADLATLLERTGSPFYSKVIRALRG